MKMSIGVGNFSRGNIQKTVDFIQAAERVNVSYCFAAEAWGQDAVTSLAYLAGKTEKIKLGTGIMQISARVPAMIAMTALSLNNLTDGRFVLGLGASGPQVVEGLHGVNYHAPLTRLRETVEIVRMAFRGERLVYQGKHFELPRAGGEGKAIRLDYKPVDIPVFLATLGPKALQYTGAAADGWLGTSFSPENSEVHLDHIRKGAESAGRTLADIELHTSCSVAIGENVEELINRRKPGVAFNMGAMGSAKTNFYNDAFQRAGYVDDARAIQQLWLAGKRDEAIKRVPDAMVTKFQAIGTPEMVRARFKKYKEVGISCLSVRLDLATAENRIAALEEVADLLKDI